VATSSDLVGVRIPGAIGFLLLVLAVAGCGGGTAGSPATGAGIPAAPAAAEAESFSVDAAAAVGELVAAGVAVDPHSSTAESDPNRLLGRPNGYASRTTFTIPGVEASGLGGDVEGCERGGCVEQWPDEVAGQARVDYINEIGKRLPAAVEYSYVREDGLVLRIAKAVTPTQAEQVSAVFLGG
jgi:hypothetical protein